LFITQGYKWKKKQDVDLPMFGEEKKSQDENLMML
jgi:hypothetical protein